MASQATRFYSITIFGYKRTGMDENDYHEYVSKQHAGHLKALLAKNDIVSYTMQHNTPETRPLLNRTHPGLPPNNLSDCDTVVQIVFKDIEDYVRVREDPHFTNVVGPDHKNFADPTRTRFVTGWFEVHVTDGTVVS